MDKMKKNTRQNILILVISFVIIAALIFVFESTKIAVPEEPETAGEGDLAEINYVLTMANGSVIDTNDISLAEEFGLKNYPKGPYRFIVTESGKVKGFDEAITGMKVGEHKIIEIEPSEEIKLMILNKTARIPFMQIYPKYAVVTKKSYLEEFEKEPIIGDTAFNPKFPWAFKVANVSEKRVALEYVVERGESYELPGNNWNSTLLAIGDITLKFRHKPVDGQIIETPIGDATIKLDRGYFNLTIDPVLGAFISKDNIPFTAGFLSTKEEYIVQDHNKDVIRLRRINYPAQERLVLDVTLLSLTMTEESVSNQR